MIVKIFVKRVSTKYTRGRFEVIISSNDFKHSAGLTITIVVFVTEKAVKKDRVHDNPSILCFVTPAPTKVVKNYCVKNVDTKIPCIQSEVNHQNHQHQDKDIE